MVSNNNKNNNSWTPPLKITALGVGITLISVVWSIILGYKQLAQNENIAFNEQKIKMIDTFSKDLLNIDYTKEVWETEGTVRLLGAVLKDTLSENLNLRIIRPCYF